MAIDDSAWFGGRPDSSVRDFFEIFGGGEALVAGGRTLAHSAGTLPEGGLDQLVADLGRRVERARAGDWQPFEHHVESLGAQYCRDGLPLSAWYAIANSFSGQLMVSAVARYAAEPQRLTQVLLTIGDFVERSLLLIAGVYDAAHQQRARDVVARHSRLIDASLDAVIEIDERGVVTEFNPAAERTFGFLRAEAIGRSLASLIIPPAAREAHRIGLERIVATGEARILGRRIELSAVRADGSEIPVELELVATDRFDGGRSFIGFMRDLGEQKRAEAEAAHAVARLETVSTTGHEFAAASADIASLLALVARRLAEILGDGCAVRLMSADGMWLEPSASFHHRDPETLELSRRVFGSERQHVGTGFAGQAASTGAAILVPVIDTETASAQMPPALRQLIQRVGVSSVLAVPLRSHHRTIGVISLIRGKPGNPYTINDQHLAQDLADRAALAIDNAMLVATLELRVRQRTAALEAANRELEAFSYSVSHDLRTPLRAIDGFARLLLDELGAELDDRGRHYLCRIRSGTQRMATLIDGLLQLARIARAPLDLAVHDLSALATEVMAEIQKREPGRTVAVHITPGLTVRADARLLMILLENLLGNAWKFTAKHAGAQIWLGSEAGAFYVRDTGAGFDMAFVEKLFVPFQRLHAVKEYDGTGIGLATVHRIVTHHGGRIRAEAEDGNGATFFFTLGESDGRSQ